MKESNRNSKIPLDIAKISRIMSIGKRMPRREESNRNGDQAMTLREVRELILSAGDQIFSVRFVKRSTGEIRDMVCRRGVTAALAETPSKPGIDFEQNRLVSVYDLKKKAYRSIPLEGVIEVHMAGKEIRCQSCSLCDGAIDNGKTTYHFDGESLKENSGRFCSKCLQESFEIRDEKYVLKEHRQLADKSQ